MSDSLLMLFPAERRSFWTQAAIQKKDLQEIRLRLGRPIVLIRQGEEVYLDEEGQFTHELSGAYLADKQDLEGLLLHICNYSLYAFEDEIRQGFITVRGGHRVGIAGQVVLGENGRIQNIKHISYINIRIAREIKGAADKVLPIIYRDGQPMNVLLISPPGCGKTTLLRDLIRQVSDGNSYGKGVCVGVVDERSELAGSYLGVAQNDLGCRSDVLDACPKKLGMMLLLRSMTPKVIAIDELAGEEDREALKAAAACGTKVIATVHGESIHNMRCKFDELFDVYILLGKRNGICKVIEAYRRKEEDVEAFGSHSDWGRLLGVRILEKRAALCAGESIAGVVPHIDAVTK